MPFPFLLAALLSACTTPPSAQPPLPPNPPLAPAPPDAPATTHLVYVPVYSSIYHGDGGATFNLAVTLSVRNTDQRAPLTLHTIGYYDNAGAKLHDYVDTPGKLGPLASSDFVVRASDVRGGVGASFLVEWSGEGITPPVIEAVMIGTASQQGISFVSEGRTLR